MGVFSSSGVGFDLGSANVTICLEGEGVVLREPSYVLSLRDDPDEILAVGRDARQMLGRTPKDVTLISPVMDGAVGNIATATELVRRLSEKALGKRRALEKSQIVVSASCGCTRVELDALQAVVRSAGAKKASLIRSGAAACLSAGAPIDEAKATMMVLIGGSTTEVTVFSMNGIVASRATRTGSLSLDEAIIRYIRREKGLIIGQRTAEDLKIDLASTREIAMIDPEEVSLRGRDAKTGRPGAVRVSARDIRKAIDVPLVALTESIREAFENTPAEMAESLLTGGLYLSGGGAQLEGLDEYLGELLGIPITIGENPQDDVARGACLVASDDRLRARLQQTGCVIEL